MTSQSPPAPQPVPLPLNRSHRSSFLLLIVIAMAIAWSIHGYSFGRGNHGVYLLDALRQSDPSLLQNDWFTTQTLQYHGAFTLFTRLLARLGILEPAFLIAHFMLSFLMHWVWLRIVLRLDGSPRVYLLSVLFFYLSAGGFGLGMYQFLQDGCFLPSNVAAVAMLWAIDFLLGNRLIPTGLCLGIASLFHLNFAVVALLFWTIPTIHILRNRALLTPYIIASACLVIPAVCNILPAMHSITAASSSPMPLKQFVSLYVYLRHPHHYAPSTWPIILWISFAWPILLLSICRWSQVTAHRSRILFFFSSLQLLAIVGAGIWYWSDTLIQMSLFRFSIYVKLLTCIAAAHLLCNTTYLGRISWHLPHYPILSYVALALLFLVFPLHHGFIPRDFDDAEYLSVCRWVADRNHTDPSAIFLVPPDENSFRLHARRAIVTNFKSVPQLRSELPDWQHRLQDILAIDDLTQLPGGLIPASRAIRDRYDSLPASHLFRVTSRYNVRYILTRHLLSDAPSIRPIYQSASARYFLYDLKQPEGGLPWIQPTSSAACFRPTLCALALIPWPTWPNLSTLNNPPPPALFPSWAPTPAPVSLSVFSSIWTN